MQIGEVIKMHRKEKGLTQEEIANRLGVTAPAVNKWENGNSIPDVMLLSPIARLLDITIDTLLSHEKGLTEKEVLLLVEEAENRLKKEPIDDVLIWIKETIEKYPSSYPLILSLAQIFDGQRQMKEIVDKEKYDDYLVSCYRRVLESDSEEYKSVAAESLYQFYMNKHQYDEAAQWLTYFSKENPERKRKQATIYSKTNRQEEAYKMYEELLYTGYQSLNLTFSDIYLLSLEEKDFDKAHMLADKIQLLARLFEFGEYHEIATKLELAILERNEIESIRIMERMITNAESIFGFIKSPLYAHMEFKEIEDDSYLMMLKEDLLNGFRDEKTFEYLADNQQWKDLVGVK